MCYLMAFHLAMSGNFPSETQLRTALKRCDIYKKSVDFTAFYNDVKLYLLPEKLSAEEMHAIRSCFPRARGKYDRKFAEECSNLDLDASTVTELRQRHREPVYAAVVMLKETLKVRPPLLEEQDLKALWLSEAEWAAIPKISSTRPDRPLSEPNPQGDDIAAMVARYIWTHSEHEAWKAVPQPETILELLEGALSYDKHKKEVEDAIGAFTAGLGGTGKRALCYLINERKKGTFSEELYLPDDQTICDAFGFDVIEDRNIQQINAAKKVFLRVIDYIKRDGKLPKLHIFPPLDVFISSDAFKERYKNAEDQKKGGTSIGAILAILQTRPGLLLDAQSGDFNALAYKIKRYAENPPDCDKGNEALCYVCDVMQPRWIRVCLEVMAKASPDMAGLLPDLQVLGR